MRSRIDTHPEEPHLDPLIRLKEGIQRRDIPLQEEEGAGEGITVLRNRYVEIIVRRTPLRSGARSLLLTLKNRSARSIRLTRLFLPLTDGLEEFLSGRNPGRLGFFSNGHQSWSHSRSYRLDERPFRSWLRTASIISGNLANLPSNRTGDFSSEMFALLADNDTREGICIGQLPPLNQFFYIRCVVAGMTPESSHFELIWDFGRRSVEPGDTVELSGVLLAEGSIESLTGDYLAELGGRSASSRQPLTGWSSWYYFFNRLDPEDLRANLRSLRESGLPLRWFQIDDGYQRLVGDWEDPAPGFEAMDALAREIREAGFRPGIWLAPFIADRRSRLVRNHPEYLLRNEHGRAIPAGYNLNWPGKLYYALDVTNPRVEEYVRGVVALLTREWGFEYLKLDFLYAACLRGGAHKELALSRAEIMRRGVEMIRDEAGDSTLLNGCGMPLVSGIGLFDSMRVGADTAPSWHRLLGRILRSESMEGVRNSIRNSFARAAMNRRLWINDPDCVFLRSRGTRLTTAERRTQINAAILAGGALFFSDNFARLDGAEIEEAKRIMELHALCAAGNTIVIDLTEKEFPELVYNSAGLLGVFNMGNRSARRRLDLARLPSPAAELKRLEEVWTGETIVPGRSGIKTSPLPPHGSLLFRVVY